MLDVTLNLRKGKYQSHRKSNDKALYMHTSSNHQPTMIKQISQLTNRGLSDNSSNETIFNEDKKDYERALKYSGFSATLI